MSYDIDRALSALRYLDPSMNRESWVRIGMAAKDAGILLDDFVKWSSNGSNFGGARDCKTVWDSFRGTGVTKATLFQFAREMGWKDPGKPRQTALEAIRGGHPRSPALQAVQRATAAPEAPRTTALDVWETSRQPEPTHPYIVRKSGSPQGIRVIPSDSTLVVQGRRVAGWLVVPAWSLEGSLRTLQLIPPEHGAKKLNLPGHHFEDGMLVLGDLGKSARIYIVEGIGQAWACRSAVGGAVVIAFGAGRMGTVAGMIRTRFPDVEVVIVSDRGKEAETIVIARKHGCLWVAMPECQPPNFDVNDLLHDEGIEAVQAILSSAQTPSGRYRPKLVHELLQAPPMQWLVRGIIPVGGLACMFGASGSGKSFLALDLCAAIAGGSDWFGRRVTQSHVVYVALEGEHGLRQRAQAWQVHHGENLPGALRFVMEPLDLRKPEDRSELVQAVIASGAKGGLLVIDTLNRASGGADENSSRDMSELVSAAKEVQSKLGGSVMLVHHSGKDQTKGLRGHSSLHAALDAAIEVTRTDSCREWRIAKSKDGGDLDGQGFGLKVVDLSPDEQGEPVTSCVVVEEDPTEAPRRLKSPQGPTQKLVHEALGRLLRKSGEFGRGGAPSSRPCVRLEPAIVEVAEVLLCRPDQRQFQTRRAITSMVAKGMYRASEGWLWDCQ